MVKITNVGLQSRKNLNRTWPDKKNCDLVNQSYYSFLFFTFKVEDIARIHGQNLHEDNHQIVMSVDGVSESKSTNTSLDVYSIKFKGCRDVYPVKIVRPLNKFQVNHEYQFSSVLSDLLSKNFELLFMVADNPKRAFLRFSLQHSARYACEYCFESGVSCRQGNLAENLPVVKKIDQQRKEIQQKIDDLDECHDKVQIDSLKTIVKHLDEAEAIAKKNSKFSHIVWPANTFSGECRTKEKTLEIVEQLEAGNNLTPAEKKGIKGRSPLLDIEYFDYVLHLPTEYMHLVPLGVVKRMIELCFNVGESRSRITKRPLSSPTLFNEMMKNVKVYKECSRRARKLDLSVMKAQELRNVIIFYFTIVTRCLEGHDKEIKTWEMLAFMIRACILPEREFSNVDVQQIKYCQKNFYTCYEQLYGIKNCTYSIHVMSSHLLLMRALGPLTDSSAFVFESFYSELRQSFQPGTNSVVKQMMQNVMMKKFLSNHVCSESIYLSEKDTPMESNSLIYVYENCEHVMYKIKSIDNDNLVCNQLGNHPINFPCTSMLDWSSVGVYRKGGLSSTDVIVHRNNVAGKVMTVDKHLFTCPQNILREK